MQVKRIRIQCILEGTQTWQQERSEGQLMLISIKQLLANRLKN